MCCTHNGHAGYSLNGHAGYSLYFLPVGGWVCTHNGHAGYSLNLLPVGGCVALTMVMLVIH